MIITVAHQKGGVGKSTLALNIAYFLQEYTATAILDCDLQGTIVGLRDQITKLKIFTGTKVLKQIIESSMFQAIVIDTAPYLSDNYPQLFHWSDLVLIPTKAGIADILAIRATIHQIQESQKKNKNLKAAIVLNMVKSRTSLTQEAREMLAGFGIPVLETMIHDRVSYVRSLAIPGGIRYAGDSAATAEIEALTKEILTLLS